MLDDLENIDDDTDKLGVHFVKVSDKKLAEEHGFTHLPALVYFEHSKPSLYEGDLEDEEKVLKWITHQRHEDTIETVNGVMLKKLIDKEDFVAVYFYPPDCDEKCDKILHEIEHIDDDSHEFGIHFRKTSDVAFGKKSGIKQFPAVALFRHKQPVVYKGKENFYSKRAISMSLALSTAIET